MHEISCTRIRHYFSPMLKLAVPIALQSVTAFLVNLADNIMIGRLGDIYVSGVYIGVQIFTLLQWFITGITTAMTIMNSQYWGRKDCSSIKKIFSIGLLFGIPISAFFTVLSLLTPRFLLSFFTDEHAVLEIGTEYLRILAVSFPFFCFSQSIYAVMRSIENTRLALYVSVSTLLVNVALNYLLIFGALGIPALGAAGAALATVISRILEFLLVFLYIIKADRVLRIKLCDLFVFSGSFAKKFLKYGTPVFLGEIVWGFNTVMRTYFIGHFTADVIAGFSVINTLSQTAFIGILALESAAGILTGKMIGEGHQDEIRPYTYNMQVIFLITGAAAVFFLCLIREPFLSFYSISTEAKLAARRLSSVMIPIVLFSTYEDMTLCGIVKYGGETSFVLKTDCIMVFLIMLPLCIAASRLGASAVFMYFLLQLDQILKCIVAFVKANRFNWAHTLTVSGTGQN